MLAVEFWDDRSFCVLSVLFSVSIILVSGHPDSDERSIILQIVGLYEYHLSLNCSQEFFLKFQKFDYDVSELRPTWVYSLLSFAEVWE